MSLNSNKAPPALRCVTQRASCNYAAPATTHRVEDWDEEMQPRLEHFEVPAEALHDVRLLLRHNNEPTAGEESRGMD